MYRTHIVYRADVGSDSELNIGVKNCADLSGGEGLVQSLRVAGSKGQENKYFS